MSKLAGCRFSPPANVAHRVQCEAKVRGTSSQQVSTQEMKTPNSRSTMVIHISYIYIQLISIHGIKEIIYIHTLSNILEINYPLFAFQV